MNSYDDHYEHYDSAPERRHGDAETAYETMSVNDMMNYFGMEENFTEAVRLEMERQQLFRMNEERVNFPAQIK